MEYKRYKGFSFFKKINKVCKMLHEIYRGEFSLRPSGLLSTIIQWGMG